MLLPTRQSFRAVYFYWVILDFLILYRKGVIHK
nr:MAG TPA: hypothetical protein [Caudoviricetes sp.]